MDCLSSFVVLWRFYAPSSVDEIVEKHLQEREQRASLAISWILLYLGFFVVWSAITDFVLGQVDFDDDTYKSTLVLSFISMIVFGILTLLKFKYAKVLSSESMHKDGLCSLIGTILSAAMFLSTLLVRANSNLWWLDPIIAFLAGLYAMYLGIVGLYTAVTVDKMSLCSCWCCGSSNSNTTNGEIESGNTASNNNNNADDSELV